MLGKVAHQGLLNWEKHVDDCERCRELALRYDGARDALICDLAALTPPLVDPNLTRWLDTTVHVLPVPERFVKTPVSLSPSPDDSPNANQASEDQVPFIPQGYEVGRKIGRGGFGVVYLVFNRVEGTIGALKLPKPERIEDKRVLARFEREIQVLKMLDHPSIVKFIEAGRSPEDIPFFVMELLRGLTLEQTIRRYGTMSVGEACRVTRDLLFGLEHARQRGIIHRDIAPKNIFLEIDGSIRIADWGLAKLDEFQVHEEMRHLSTSTGEYWGTPSYSAPEQLKDFSRCDCRADIYSVGWTMVYLLTGCRPGRPIRHSKDTISLESPGIHLLSARPELPPALVNLLRSMLFFDVESRPLTPVEVALALQDFISNQPSTISMNGVLGTDKADLQSNSYEEDLRPFFSKSLLLLREMGVESILPICDAIDEARLGTDLSAKPMRIAIVGAPCVGKSEFIRALVPELAELTWQTPNSRFTKLEYSESNNALVRYDDGKETGPVSISELTSLIDNSSRRKASVELKVTADVLARGLSFHEFRFGFDSSDPWELEDSDLLHVDFVVCCVPPDLSIIPSHRRKALFKRNGHNAIIWVVNRLDSVRRESEREKLLRIGNSRLMNLTSLGTDGIQFVSSIGSGKCYEENSSTDGLSHVLDRFLRFFGPWEYHIRTLRPLNLLQEAVRLTRDKGVSSVELAQLDCDIKTIINRCRIAFDIAEKTMNSTFSNE